MADGARRDERNAIEIHEPLVEKYPDSQRYRDWLAKHYGFLATVVGTNGDSEQEGELRRKEVAQRKRLVEEFPKVVRLRTALGTSLRYQATFYDQIGQQREALDAYQQALEIAQQSATEFPKNKFHRRALVMCRCDIGLSHFDHGDWLYRQGRVQEATESYRRSLFELEKVVDEFPDHPMALNRLGWLLAVCQDESIRDSKRAVELSTQAAKELSWLHFWFTVVVAQFRDGNYQAAVEAAAKVDEIFDGKYYVRDKFFLAMAHFRLGNHDDARRIYQQAATWVDSRHLRHDIYLYRDEAARTLGIQRSPAMNTIR